VNWIASLSLLSILIGGFQCCADPDPKHLPSASFGISNSFLNDLSVESFISGLTFALSKDAYLKNEISIETSMEHSPLSATELTRKFIANGSRVILGFPGSHDCLLAAKEAHTAHVTGIFLNCAHNDFKQYSGEFATTESDLNDEVTSMLDFLSKMEKKNRGIIIVQPSHVASRAQGELYRNLATKYKADLDYDVVDLDGDGRLNEKTLGLIRSKFYSYAVLTAYPDLLQSLRNQLSTENFNAHLYGSSAWDNLEVARRFIVNLKSRFIYPTTWSRNSTESIAFIKSYQMKFNKAPTPEAAFGYDFGNILIKINQSEDGKTFEKKVVKAIQKKSCFNNLLATKLCLGDESGHTRRVRTFVQVTSKGLEPVYAK
jgi:ABC-type branched-subunit amino acid transport system substrate-binding protein